MWAREHCCPRNARISVRAAACGYLDVSRWAREHECIMRTICDMYNQPPSRKLWGKTRGKTRGARLA